MNLGGAGLLLKDALRMARFFLTRDDLLREELEAPAELLTQQGFIINLY